MALTQTQIIRSLADALTWFEKELEWGVAPGDLNHLTGRIGELYAAMITRGQMALKTNERGYDVVSADNERISVKTVTSSNSVPFNQNTFHLVDRVMVLRINVDVDAGLSIETLLDCSADDARGVIGEKFTFYTNYGNRRPPKLLENLIVKDEAQYEDHLIREYENGTVVVICDQQKIEPARPVLKKIAADIGVDLVWSTGLEKNTRHLGTSVIKSLKLRELGEQAGIERNL